MSSRYSQTEKWADAWFSQLSPKSKLLFLYFCDNCNIAGFIEIIPKRICIDTGLTSQELDKCLIELSKCFVYSNDNSVIYLRTFLKHQKNLPLNENNKAHLGILKTFADCSHKFNIVDVNEFIYENIKGLTKGLVEGYKQGASISPICISNGIGNGNGKEETPEEKKEEVLDLDFLFDNDKKNYIIHFIKQKCTNIKKLKQQLTDEQAAKLIENYKFEEISRIIAAMENYKPLAQKNNSVYLTMINWINRERK
jgi:hypothetical protein